MAELPAGTITLLFTDIEGSTRLLQKLGAIRYGKVLSAQRAILRDVFQNCGGREVDTQGDAFFVSFPRASDAIAAVAEVQRALASQNWPQGVEVRVRMGLHTGEPLNVDEGYIGLDVHRAARLAHAASGGQVLLSETTTALLWADLAGGIGLRDLGVHRLKDMPRPERIHQLLIPGLQADFPPLKSLDAHPNNLPAQTTPFIGRVSEMAALNRILVDPSIRLVTILGAGGMGKTRLSLAAAEALYYSPQGVVGLEPQLFPDGVFFVPLASLEEADAIPFGIGEAVGVEISQGKESKDQVKDYLANKRLLLVLDNFEHLHQGADLISDLLAGAPGLKILATSRQKLDLRGETAFLLEGMNLPHSNEARLGAMNGGESFDSIALFLQAGRRADPTFVPTEDDWRWIFHICQQMDGLPLGIELAAGWVDMLTPREIATEIQDSLDFLETKQRDVPSRQQSLRAVFDTTWNLLRPDECEVLKRLSVFRGGFTRGAARAVAGADLRMMMRLVDKSLLQRDPLTMRFRIHEVLRNYAEELLIQSDQVHAVRDSHVHYFSVFLDQRNEKIYGGRQIETLKEIELDFLNLKMAWDWCVDHMDDTALDRMIDPIYVFCEWLNRYQDGERMFQRARLGLAPRNGDEPTSTWGRSLLPWYDMRTEGRGRLDETEETRIQDQASRSLATAQTKRDPEWMAYSLVLLGALADDKREYKRAISFYEQALQNWHIIGDRYWVQIRLGLCCRKAGQNQEALRAFQDSLQRGRDLGDLVKISWSLFNIGEIFLLQCEGVNDQHLESIEAHWREANRGFRQIGASSGIIWTNSNLSLVSFLKHDFQEARALAEETLTLVSDFSAQAYGRREAHGMLANISVLAEDFEAGSRHLQAWLASGPEMKTALKSNVVCRPVMMLLTLPSAALILAEKGQPGFAVELIALASSHAANPFDLKLSWPTLKNHLANLEVRLGTARFEQSWQQGQRAGFDRAVRRLHKWI